MKGRPPTQAGETVPAYHGSRISFIAADIHGFRIANSEKRVNTGRGSNQKYLPFAFTELGVAMLSSVLHSETAIDINRKIMRAFVELRRFVGMVSTDYVELKKEITEVRNYIEEILADQNDINEEHSAQLEAISLTLVELQSNHPQKERRRIGFRQSDGTDQ